MTAATGLRVEGLHKTLGKTKALNGLDLSFSAGRLHTLIGPNGSGKTTLLRVIMGLLRPDEGSVKLLRYGMTPAEASSPARLAYMSQSDTLYKDLSVGENLAFFAKISGVSKKEYKGRRDELLKLTHLDNALDRPAGALSGGQYKKLGLICGLLSNPEIFLLDEPTTGLDPLSRRDFWNLLRSLTETSSLTIVLATPYMDEGERSAEIHLILRGRRLAEGEPETVLRESKATTIEDVFLDKELA